LWGLTLLEEQLPPEAKVRGSNPLGRAILWTAASDERRTTRLRSNGSSYSELNEQFIAC
jgi:hypothetical protein